MSLHALNCPRVRALVIDTETSALDPDAGELIGLSIQAVELDRLNGRVIRRLGNYQGWRAPARPLTPEAEAIIGLTNADLAGCDFDRARIDAMVAEAALVVAHNAAFDRPFVEAQLPAFRTRAWACSLTEIDWFGRERQPHASLGHLFGLHGWTSDASVEGDAGLMVNLLASPLPVSPSNGFFQLLEAASATHYRIWLPEPPRRRHKMLALEGYEPAADRWFADREESKLIPLEVRTLAEQVYGGELTHYEVEQRCAFVRFSARRGHMRRVRVLTA